MHTSMPGLRFSKNRRNLYNSCQQRKNNRRPYHIQIIRWLKSTSHMLLALRSMPQNHKIRHRTKRRQYTRKRQDGQQPALNSL